MSIKRKLVISQTYGILFMAKENVRSLQSILQSLNLSQCEFVLDLLCFQSDGKTWYVCRTSRQDSHEDHASSGRQSAPVFSVMYSHSCHLNDVIQKLAGMMLEGENMA